MVAVILICWYFRHIVFYVAASAVLSLIGRPLRRCLLKLHIRQVKMPSWTASLITLILLFSLFFSFFLLLTPLVGKMSSVLSSINPDALAVPMAGLNEWLRESFPKLGPDFRLELYVMDQLFTLVNMPNVSTVVTSVSSFVADTVIGLFSIFFISFFFINQEGLLTETVSSMVPADYEEKVKRTSRSVSSLLSRYFIGILIESLCIIILNGLGLSLIARMEVTTALTVAVFTGLINVIPYIGPLAGELVAVMMALVTRSGAGFNGSLVFFLIVVLAVCLTTQLIDNFVFQPVIYSSSVKAHPLEIFLVILMAGYVWGVLGMLVAVPGYTVVRVIAGEFLSKYRFVQILTKRIHEGPIR